MLSSNTKSPKDGAQRKREHDARKREAGLKEFRAWVTPDEAKQLREFLRRIRETFGFMKAPNTGESREDAQRPVERLVRLPDDVARCAGVCKARDWMDQCKTCARRLAPLNNRERAIYMVPPLMVFDHCERYLST